MYSEDVKHYTEKEAARLVGFSTFWFQRKRAEGTGPPYRKIGSSVRYPADKLLLWLESHPVKGGDTHES